MSKGYLFFISDAVHAHRCASDAHRCTSAKIGAWPTLIRTLWDIQNTHWWWAGVEVLWPWFCKVPWHVEWSEVNLSLRGPPIDGNPSLPPNCASGSAFAKSTRLIVKAVLITTSIDKVLMRGALSSKQLLNVQTPFLGKSFLFWGGLEHKKNRM